MRRRHESRRRRRWLCGLLLLAGGCGSAAPSQRPPDQIAAPATRFRALEERLLKASAVRLTFHVIAEGAVEADLRGELDVAPGGRIRLTGSGPFDGQTVDLFLQADEGQYEFGSAAGRTSVARPAQLEEALLVGFTRMGILHNLARLSSVAPPDHAEGGVSDWVIVSAFATDVADAATVSFDLAVAGKPAGSASVEIDSLGRPVARRQTVLFPSGQMRVVELYSDVTIEP